MDPSSSFRPPLQRRSERTLHDLVEAANQALATKSFDELTLNELTERAGVTVGAFYQRFASKSAFLSYLEQEAYEEIRKGSAVLFDAPQGGDGRPIREHLRAFVTQMAALYQAHPPFSERSFNVPVRARLSKSAGCRCRVRSLAVPWIGSWPRRMK